MLLIITFLALLAADEPPQIQFPDVSPPAVVVPSPEDANVRMRQGECYVVAHSAPLLVYPYDDGVVSVEYRAPSTSDRELWFLPPGSARAIWRTYAAGLHLYIITPSSEGSTVVLFAQSLDASAVQRRVFVVSGGGPQPPPGPTPTPVPTPAPTPQPPPNPKPAPGSLRVVMVSDESDPVPARLAVTSLNVRRWLDANCVLVGQLPAWRLYDRSALDVDDLSEEDPTLRKLVEQTRGSWPEGPVAIVAVGNQAKVFSIRSVDQLLATMKEIIGAK